MAYYEPGQEPVGNRSWLGWLRVVTSDQRAALIARQPVVFTAKYMLIALGLAAAASVIGAQFDAQTDAAALAWRLDKPIVLTALGAVLVYLIWKGANFRIGEWRRHFKTEPHSLSKFFWSTDRDGNIPPDAGGIVFNRKLKKWMLHPARSQDEGLRRGINFKGLDFFPFVMTDSTVGVEYYFTGVIRCIKHYFGSKRWTGPRADRKVLYKGIINTQTAAFICADKDDPNYGNVVLLNAMLPYDQHTTRAYSRIVMHLDHDAWEVAKITMERRDNDGETITEVWGSANAAENTRKDLTAEQQLDTLGQLLNAIGSLYTHAFSHVWANGTNLIPENIWPLAKKSSDLTQWMNTQAMFMSWFFADVTRQDITTLLLVNHSNGLPFHSSGDVMKLVAERSDHHKMVTNARKRLIQYLQDKFGKDVDLFHADAIISTTTMHAADHYYGSKYYPKDGNLIPLKTDYSGLLMCSFGTIRYRTARLLAKEHLSDPICRILYEEAQAIDPHFADTALTIGCAC